MLDFFVRDIDIFNIAYRKEVLYVKLRGIFLIIICFVCLLGGCSYVPYDNTNFSGVYTEERYQEQVEQNRVTEDDAYNAFDDKSSSIYYETFDRLTSAEDMNEDSGPLSERIFRSAYQTYATIRSISPMLFLGSIGVGLLMFIFARHNKAIRRVGMYGFIIAIPLFLIVFIFGGGIVMDLFLF